MSAEQPPSASTAATWSGIAAVLRGGTLLAVTAIGLGLAWALATPGDAPAKRTVVELIGAGGPDGLIAAGLLALTLVPIAAIVAAIVTFARSGEGRALLTTAAVLVLLLVSLVAAALLGAAN